MMEITSDAHSWKLLAEHDQQHEQQPAAAPCQYRGGSVRPRILPRILREYAVWRLIDTMCVLGTLLLGVCYAIARHLGHVGVFCDISDLVVHLPERILFRLNFALVGGLLAVLASPIHDLASSRVGGMMPKIGASFQFISGIGVILVGACGPSEIYWFHITSAVMGFGGSAVAQIIYAWVFLQEDKQKQPISAKRILAVRCVITGLFLASAIGMGLGSTHPRILPEPWEHIFEWSMWFTLLLWYGTFRWDFADFDVASVETTATGQEKVEGAVMMMPRNSSTIVNTMRNLEARNRELERRVQQLERVEGSQNQV